MTVILQATSMLSLRELHNSHAKPLLQTTRRPAGAELGRKAKLCPLLFNQAN